MSTTQTSTPSITSSGAHPLAIVGIVAAVILALVAAFIQLSYFGWTFQTDKKTVDPKDWRRKFLIVASYVFIVACLVGNGHPVFLPHLIIGIVTLTYLGGSWANDDDNIYTDSASRRFLIFCAWLVIAIFVVWLAIEAMMRFGLMNK